MDHLFSDSIEKRSGLGMKLNFGPNFGLPQLQAKQLVLQIFPPDLLDVCPGAKNMASHGHIYYMEVIVASAL